MLREGFFWRRINAVGAVLRREIAVRDDAARQEQQAFKQYKAGNQAALKAYQTSRTDYDQWRGDAGSVYESWREASARIQARARYLKGGNLPRRLAGAVILGQVNQRLQ